MKKRVQSLIKFIIKVLELAKGPAFVLVVGLGLISLLTSTSLPWRIPVKPFIVLSGSMRPTILEGSVVFVDRKTQQVKIGDIVTFLRPGNAKENVTHRIVSVEEKNGVTLYKTKGDANKSQDIWSVRKEAMWGKVLFSVPLLGYLISFTKTRLGVLLVVVLPLTVIAFDELRVIFNEIRSWKKKKSGKGKTPPATLTALLLLVSYGFFTVSTQTSMSAFSDTVSVTNQQVTTSCWIAPSTPIQTFPSDNTNTNASNIFFTWDASTTSCPTGTLTYNFQLFSDVGLTTLVAQSGFTSSLSYLYTTVPEGEYWWRVQVQDQFSNAAAGGGFHLFVDRTAPSTTLSVTGSGYKAVTENVTNGDFETGTLSGWNIAGTVARVGNDAIATASGTVVPVDGTSMARLGSKTASTTTNGNYVWSNRLMQSFATGAKSLALFYNIYTRDYAPNDDPGFFIRINGQEVFRANTLAPNPTSATDNAAYSTGWKQFTYNLAEMTGSDVNLAIYAGNTGDLKRQTWAYVDKITTYFVSARGNADYKLSATDAVSGVNQCFYNVDGGGYTSIANNSTFQVTSDGTHTLSYYCSDNAGNNSAVTPATVITDTTAPSAISDLAVSATTVNSATLTWTAPGNDGSTGRASSYDVRYSTSSITDDASFNAATQVSNVPSPQTSGTAESLTITGLNQSTTYYFAIKSTDEAPNTSSLSNPISGMTAASVFTVNPGDVVINELMWMGSSVSTADEWIELRNTTSHLIDLSNFVLTRWNGTSDVTMVTIPASKSIAAGGYFLISNFVSNASQMKDSITVDDVDTGVNLSNTALSIKLKDASSNLIDSAWDQTAPKEGVLNAGSSLYYSMERTGVPGDGTSPLSWYTCIDTASTTDFFDAGAVERGTPGAANRSENEPLSYQKFYPSYNVEATDSGDLVSADATGSAVLDITPTPTATETATPTPTPMTASDSSATSSGEQSSPTPTLPPSGQAPNLSSDTSGATPSGEQSSPTPTIEPTISPSETSSPAPTDSPSPTATETLIPTPPPTESMSPAPSP